MRAILAVALGATLLLASTAVADSPLSAVSLAIVGEATVETSAGGVYLLAQAPGLSWFGTAGHAVLERTYINVTRLDDPRGTGDLYRMYGENPVDRDVVRETIDLGAVRLTTTASRADAAVLVEALGAPFTASASAEGALGIAAAQDPEIRQFPADFEADMGGTTDLGIRAVIRGEYVALTTETTEVLVRGDVVLQLFNVDYTIDAGEGPQLQQTGFYDLSRAGPAAKSRVEAQRLTLRDAELRLQTPDAGALFALDPVVSFQGHVLADEAEGALVLDDEAFPARDGTAEGRGSGTLRIEAREGSLQVAPSAPASTSGRTLAGASAAPLASALAGTLLLALLLGGGWLLRRSRREEGDLEAALLAMEAKRWDEALAQIDRLLARRPADAMLLLDRAICYEHTGRLHEARLSCEAALVEAPANAEAHYYYARILARLRMSTTCLAHLQRALALDARLKELARHERAFQAFTDHPQFAGLLR